MKNVVLCFTFITILAVCGVAQAKLASSGNSKFEHALETQISCWQEPQPGKAIRALQRSRIVEKNPYVVSDSLNFFRVRRPLNVLSFNVYSVFGWDYVSGFDRGPGTAPGIWVGIVVPYSVEEVKAKLKHSASKLNLQKIVIEDSIDITEANTKAHVRTQIGCHA